MIKLFTVFCICLLLILTSCKTPCNDPSSPAVKIPDYIIPKWDCKNADAVRTDVTNWLANHNMCKRPEGKEGFIANLACPIVANKLREYVATKVPPTWGCDSSKVGVDAADALTKACELIPF